MKKLIFTLLLAVATTCCMSQISFGVKAGLNVNTIAIENLPDKMFDPEFKSMVGFHGGFYARFKLSEKLAVSPELQFVQRGAKSGDETYTINYLELPVLLSYSPVKLISLEAGPSIGFNLGAKTKSGSLKGVYDESIDLGATAGIRVNATEKISLGARYYYGFSSISRLVFTNNGVDATYIDQYNRNIYFSVYYSLK